MNNLKPKKLTQLNEFHHILIVTGITSPEKTQLFLL